MNLTEKTSIVFTPSARIASFKPYFFATLSQKIAALRSQGVDVIRLDMGSPDLPPPDFIINSLVEAARRPDTHGYAQMGGTPEYKKACAQYYQQRFGVELDPQKEVLGLLGSKEGLFNLCQVLVNPGDFTLVPDPAYPVYASATTIAGGQVHWMPLLPENDFLPDLEAIPDEVSRRAKILWLNYPNNPTGAVAPLSFLEKAIEFARKNNILLAHDAPYNDVCFDGYSAPSILQIPGAKDVAVEFNSLSKTYNMAGWRLGMAVGNAQVLSYLHTYKSQADSSHFEPIMRAAAVAMLGEQSWLKERNQIYQERRDLIVAALRQAGFTLQVPPAAIYVWARLPEKYTDSISFCRSLLEETGVSMTPGVIYGQAGEGYLRISLGTPTERVQEAMSRLVAWTK